MMAFPLFLPNVLKLFPIRSRQQVVGQLHKALNLFLFSSEPISSFVSSIFLILFFSCCFQRLRPKHHLSGLCRCDQILRASNHQRTLYQVIHGNWLIFEQVIVSWDHWSAMIIPGYVKRKSLALLFSLHAA